METIAAIATPPGAGALGVLRVSGSGARDVARGLLFTRGGAAPVKLPPREASYAEAREGGELIDQVVATFYPDPASATGEDVLEISAHGSPIILRRLLEAALRLGARPAAPGEFTLRAYLNGKMDLAQAEAVGELIAARTQAARRAALSQLEGGLSAAVHAAKEPILEILIRVEAALDHPEEDLPSLAPERLRAEIAAAAAPIERLRATFSTGKLLTEGARVCIVGRPNAGKSSLLNALLGSDRAIVSARPGTTRDTIEEPLHLAGSPALLIDTAGLRESPADEAEEMGVARARKAFDAADLALLVMDRSRPADPEDEAVHRRVLEAAARAGRPIVTVANKSDLPRRLAFDADVSVSALRREGIGELVDALSRKLGLARREEGITVLCVRHERALAQAGAELGEAASAISRHPGRWEDRAASRLRQALRHLSEIIGEGAPDEVLHGIFSRFCIGK